MNPQQEIDCSSFVKALADGKLNPEDGEYYYGLKNGKWEVRKFPFPRITETIEEVSKEVCEKLCKYHETIDDDCVCDYMRQGNNCPLEKI